MASMQRSTSRVLDHHLDLHLRQEVDHVLGAAVQLGVALLPAEALDLGHRQARHADVGQGLAHLFELEGLDDGGDLFHGPTSGRALHCRDLSMDQRGAGGRMMHARAGAQRPRPNAAPSRLAQHRERAPLRPCGAWAQARRCRTAPKMARHPHTRMSPHRHRDPTSLPICMTTRRRSTPPSGMPCSRRRPRRRPSCATSTCWRCMPRAARCPTPAGSTSCCACAKATNWSAPARCT